MVEFGFSTIEDANWSMKTEINSELIERLSASFIPKNFVILPPQIRNFLEIYDVYERDEALLLGATPHLVEEERHLGKFAKALQRSKVVERNYYNRPTLYRATINGAECVAAFNFMKDDNLQQIYRVEDRHKYRFAHQLTGILIKNYDDMPVAASRFEGLAKKFHLGK